MCEKRRNKGFASLAAPHFTIHEEHLDPGLQHWEGFASLAAPHFTIHEEHLDPGLQHWEGVHLTIKINLFYQWPSYVIRLEKK